MESNEATLVSRKQQAQKCGHCAALPYELYHVESLACLLISQPEHLQLPPGALGPRACPQREGLAHYEALGEAQLSDTVVHGLSLLLLFLDVLFGGLLRAIVHMEELGAQLACHELISKESQDHRKCDREEAVKAADLGQHSQHVLYLPPLNLNFVGKRNLKSKPIVRGLFKWRILHVRIKVEEPESLRLHYIHEVDETYNHTCNVYSEFC